MRSYRSGAEDQSSRYIFERFLLEVACRRPDALRDSVDPRPRVGVFARSHELPSRWGVEDLAEEGHHAERQSVSVGDYLAVGAREGQSFALRPTELSPPIATGSR